MTRVIAVTNQKGGVGKTTTAVNLAACLAEAEFDVLLLDMDPQANASAGLRDPRRGPAPHQLRRARRRGRRRARRRCAPPSTISRLVPACPDLAGAVVELANADGNEYVLEYALTGHVDQYDFVFIDCPPSLGVLTVNSLVAAREVLIPVQAEYYALEGLAALLETVGLVQEHLNPELAILGVLVTMYDGRTRLGREVAGEVPRAPRASTSSRRSSRATSGSARRRATASPSHAMMRPAPAATPTSISPRRSSPVTEPREPDAPAQRPRAGRGPARRRWARASGRSSARAARRSGAPGGAALQEGRLRELPLADISVNRRQPRRTFADDELQELAASIRALGVVQPVVVRPLQTRRRPPRARRRPPASASSSSPASGACAPRSSPASSTSRRWCARPTRSPSLEIALAENVAREDLNAIEEAQAYAALVDEFGLTHERIAELVGRSRVAVTNLLRLLDLPDDVQAMIERGDLSEGHGRALLGAAGPRRAPPGGAPGRRARGSPCARSRRWCASSQEAAGGAAPAARPAAGADYADLVDELYGVFEAPVRIRSGKRGGTIQIGFKDAAELRRLVELLRSLG